MVVARVRAWHSEPALELARKADCKAFLSALPCQLAIHNVWTGNVRCSSLTHFVTLFLPFLLFSSRLFDFGPDVIFPLSAHDVKKVEETNRVELPKTCWEKFQRFHSCPMSKFTWNLVSPPLRLEDLSEPLN